MRQATRERYREEENFDDDLVEEDSEGNKFVERILKADERRFREDDSGAFTTPDRPTIALSNVTPSLPHSLGIPPPAQTHPRAAPSPPATTSHLPATQLTLLTRRGDWIFQFAIETMSTIRLLQYRRMFS
ncbi:hypothetical protein PI124_g8048 [Phytophthora idaei]|nr:hypothetical protein PI125_g9514 [Phytophthora idaei]KAG3147921.1 hypothetical protein PI126_g12671 [Phytophthora idaei]KAG3247243.1 hypothetical protein PI124_g8048 [Phytophthora idaei]